MVCEKSLQDWLEFSLKRQRKHFHIFLNFYSFLNVLGTCHVLGQEKDHNQFIIIFPFNEADFFSQYMHFAVHWFGQENLSLLRKILNKTELLAHIQKYSMFLFWVLLEMLH